MHGKKKEKMLVEVIATKKYASVILTPKEFRKGRKRYIDKHT